MSASLKDIASALNLSKTTVSWVLSGRAEEKGISPATRQRVLRYATDLDYQPNLLARSLNTGTTGTIGLILPSISDSFYSQVAREVEMEAERHGYSLMICSSESEIERENRMIRVFRAKRVDGIILAPTKISKAEVERLVDENYPLVTFDRYFPELPVPYVIVDNEQSSYDLVRRLIAKGCRKIAVVTTNPHLRTMDMRREGYVRALSEAGLAVGDELYAEVAFAGYEKRIDAVLDRLFERVPDVDGFFFTTHILALEAFRYCYEKGIDINAGYGLCCIHEMPAMRVLAPGMSVARMPIAEIGRQAVQLLLARIRSGGETSSQGESLVLPCELCFRD